LFGDFYSWRLGLDHHLDDAGNLYLSAWHLHFDLACNCDLCAWHFYFDDSSYLDWFLLATCAKNQCQDEHNCGDWE
jgi:hypothetical protein